MSSNTSPEASGSASGDDRIKHELPPPGTAGKTEGNASSSNSYESKSKTIAAAQSTPAPTSATNDDNTPDTLAASAAGTITAVVGAEDANGGIITPHDHDVLSGRGNSVNHHPGNEYFRSLVRHHKLAYVRCPKPQKEQFSKLIVSTVRDREPPGRFLKQNPKSKSWYNIGTQKALDKTRQALREGAPATVAGLMLSQGLTPSAAAAAGLTPSQAVSTLSSVSGDNEMMQNSASAAGGQNGSSNHFLSHHQQQQQQQHAAHSHHSAAHHAAAVAVAANQHQQQQHNAAMAAHSRMINSPYYNAAVAQAAGAGVNYPNPPKPPMTASSSAGSVSTIVQDGASSDPPSSKPSSTTNATKPTPQSPQRQHPSNPRLPPAVATATYPPIPPPANSDEAMKFHAAQVVRMATATHAATGINASGGGSGGSSGTNFGNPSALAAAAGTFNPVLLEHIMAQHRGGAGGSASIPPQSAGGGIDWNGGHSGRQPPPPSGGRGVGDYASHQYPGYPPAPNNGPPQQHEDIHTKSQRQEAYIAHLQERIQQQERQLLTLCSHILLSPPTPPGPNVNVNANNPTPPITASSNLIAGSSAAGSNGPQPVAGGGPLHNGISHPQYAAAVKMNAAAAVANINATAAAVKELQSYAGASGGNPNANSIVNDRVNTHHGHNPRHQQHAAAVAAAAVAAAVSGTSSTHHKTSGPPLPAQFTGPTQSSSSNTTDHSEMSTSSVTVSTPSSSNSKPQKTPLTNCSNGYTSTPKEKANNNSGGTSTAAVATPKSPTPNPEKSSDDGDAVAALLALGIGKSPSSESPTAAEAEAATDSEVPGADDSSASSSKKRKLKAGGRRTLPLKKKQMHQQENSSKAVANNSYHQLPLQQQQQQRHQQEQQQQQQQQHHLHHPQPAQQQQHQHPKALPINTMMMQNSHAVIPKPPVDIGPAPEQYLYAEVPIHEPHVHDVLCGRGALTNEHPGNEWFRRLVRSNRQLYRSCPKHTKLLVAKAIVQAVQRTQRSPPGRFLEKTKTADGSVSNSWTPITYKSAVEKASQALREKVTPNWGAPPSNFPLSKALEAARAVAYLEKEYPSGDGFGGTNLLALIMAVVQSAGLD